MNLTNTKVTISRSKLKILIKWLNNYSFPYNFEIFFVRKCVKNHFLSRLWTAILARAEKAVYGYKSKFSEDYLSIYEALQKGMLIENHAIRLLEAQIVTGGIVDPHKHHRLGQKYILTIAQNVQQDLSNIMI